jgi:hypothetical protein
VDKILDKIIRLFYILDKKGRFYMKSCMILSSIIIILASVNLCGQCTPCAQGSHDWFKVYPEEMKPLPEPGFGVAKFHFVLFTTAADGCDSFPQMFIKRACFFEFEPILPWYTEINICSWLCGANKDCDDLAGHACDPCGFVSHQLVTWDLIDTLGGKGDLIIEFQGKELYNQHFDFTAGIIEPGVPVNIEVTFLNKNLSSINPADVHDPQEAIALLIRVEWDGEPYSTYSASIKSRDLNDSIVISCPMVYCEGFTAYYRKKLPAGSLTGIYGNFSNVCSCTDPDILTASAIGYVCDFEIPHRDATARFGNIRLYITSLSFLNDFPLYEDSIMGTTDPPPYEEKLIEDPVWVLDPPRNKSAFYMRDTIPSITVEVKTQCNIDHTLDYQIMGIPSDPYPINIYRTTMDSGSIYGYLDTISGITFQDGSFPDSVEILDTLKYHWMYRKSLIGGVQGFRPMNTTGPHKIFLSYGVPRLDTVNELGLKYICNYARNLNDSLDIFTAGVESIYKQQWKYNTMHYVFSKPLDMVRLATPIGQCIDYANLLTYFSAAVGLKANTVNIFNGRDNPPYIDHYSFIYSGELPDTEFYNLWSNELRAINGKKERWLFIYHAVTGLGLFLGDPVFNIVKKESDYTIWWKYYLHPYPENQPFSHIEPPPLAPYYYRYNIFAVPDSSQRIGPYNLRMRRFRFIHP